MKTITIDMQDEQKKIAKEAIELMERDFDSGGWSYPHRSELHDR